MRLIPRSSARRYTVLFLLFAVGSASRAAAEWVSLGKMPAPRREANTLRFQNQQGVVAITALAPDVIRVRFSPTRQLGRDHSYAVVGEPSGKPDAKFDISGDRSVITTSALKVTIRHSPFRIAFADAAGNSLDEDDPQHGIAFSGRTVRVWKRLRDDEHVYGFGEKTGRLDKRGWQLGGYNYTMWNSDTYAYDVGTDPIYASVPFFIILRSGVAHGMFFDNTFRSNFDIGRTSQGMYSFGADGGELNYYFLYGPDPKRVISRYTDLTGRMPLPPRWSLGYHQCRYSYYPDAKVRFIAENFRLRQIPADVLWLDIHYLDGYKPFTWDLKRFPDPPRLLGDLRAIGFRVVTIIDPHPKNERGYQPYDSGVAGNHFVRQPDGSIYEAPVWPSKAEINPGPSVFPDFSRPATREWWGNLYAPLLKMGVAGIWNDMNEPAVFETPTGTMPLSVHHDNEGQPTDHREIHNVYGMLMTRATYEGLLRARPNERPFVLSRASFAGGQRYAALWPGDNVSDWSHLRGSLATLMGLGLSGFAFVGSDIGGFAESPTAELFTRWLQAGVFYPFMRAHTTFGTPDQEPWSYGVRHEAWNRRAIELRYELLPHIYNVMHEASRTGVPAMRPLFLEYPDDSRTYSLDNQFLFGRDLLIAPVLRPEVDEQTLYLPKGDWYDFWTGTRHRGGSDITVPVTLASIPIFVREGAFIFRQPVVQHTEQLSGQPLTVAVFPAAQSESWLYEDDGETLEHQRGVFLRRRFSQRCSHDEGSCTFEVGASEGTYRPEARDLMLSVRWDGEPRQVRLLDDSQQTGSDTPLTRFSLDQLSKQPRGWAVTQGFVVIKQPDSLRGFRLTINSRN